MASATLLQHNESIDSRNFECSHARGNTGNPELCDASENEYFDEEDPCNDGQNDDISDSNDDLSENPVCESENAAHRQNDDDMGDNCDYGDNPVCDSGNVGYPPSISKIQRSPSLASEITFSESQLHEEHEHCTREWSKKQKILAVLGCLSSIFVCIIRLKIDTGSRTYLIHSIVVFFDMVLIHLFTSTVWLSVTGEFVTIVSMLLYHFTKQKVWELLETTLLAMICSFHMISSRSEHWDREEELEGLIGLEIIANDRRHSKSKVRCVTVDRQDPESKIVDGNLDRLKNGRSHSRQKKAPLDRLKNGRSHSRQKKAPEATSVDTVGILTGKGITKQHNLINCSKHFFEHFLDGSAGVMYTSFLGLIVDEFLMWFGDDKKNG